MTQPDRSVDIQRCMSQLSACLDSLLHIHNSKADSWPTNGREMKLSIFGSEQSRQQLIGKLELTRRLLYDPTDYLKELTQGNSIDLGIVRVLVRSRIAKSVPLDRDIDIGQLATKVSVSRSTLVRILSYAETLGLFRFTTPDGERVAHTNLSAGLAEGTYADLADWDVKIPPDSSLALSSALLQYGECDGPEHAPFSHGLATDDNFYTWHTKNSTYGNLFHRGMQSEQQDARLSPQHIVHGYDWSGFNKKTIVDVGGSHGHVARSILEEYPAIEFIVQDLPDVIANADCGESTNLKFMAHDFFETQPCAAQAYLLRYVLHNWTEQDCVRILRALRPALHEGTKLFVVELVQDYQNCTAETWFKDRIVKRRDMQMMCFVGASERSIQQYDLLMRSTIPELRFDGVHKPPGSFVAMLEWTYAGARPADEGVSM